MSTSASDPGAPEDAPAAGEGPDPEIDVAPRPLGEIGVLPLGGEVDPLDSADQPVGEVGQLPGVPMAE